jgi:hypothetical protein
MRKLACVVTVILSACAARHAAPVHAPERLISTSWATVMAVPPGTDVGVALEDGAVRVGRISEVSEQALTLWEKHGAARYRRDRILRLAVRTSKGTSHVPRIVGGAVAGALIGGVAGVAATLEAENDAGRGARWVALFLGAGLGAALGSGRAPVERFHDEVIYIHP